MTPTLWRFSLRSLTRHPLLTGLSVVGIAIGIAVVVSMDLANESARRAFGLSAEAVGGKATHSIVGGPSGLEEELYRRLRVELGMQAAAPVVEGFARVPSAPGRTFQVLGLDFFAEARLRPHFGKGSLDLRALMTTPASALLAETTAAELEIHEGETISLVIEGAERRVKLVGLIRGNRSGGLQAIEDSLLMDISSAQEILGKVGRLDRIDLIAPASDPKLLDRVRAILPAGTQLIHASARVQTLDRLTRAFRLNLTALSLLALLVGIFLIYNTMTFSLVQRRELLGTLRALGVTRGQVFWLLLGEAGLLGIVGTALGMVGGIALGHGLVRLVTRTINDLYFVVNVRQLALDPITLVKGIALGIGATLAAALPPALESTRVAPNIVLQRSTIESRLRQRLPLFGVVGALCSVLGVALFAFPSRDPFLAFAGLAAVLIGFALVSPLATYLLATGARPLLAKSLGLWGRMAARGVITSLSRTAIAVAALSIAVATTVGVSLMVSSFRGTVSRWLESSLIADVYATAPGLVSRRGEATIRAELVDRLRRAPGVQAITSVRTARVRWNEQPIDLVVTDLSAVSQRPYRFAEGNPEEIWPALESADAVAVSEPFAFHHRVEVGQSLDLTTDDGVRPFRIVGVYYDYGSDSGVVMINRKRYERHFRDRGITGLGFIATPGYSIDKLLSELRAIVGRDEQQLLLRSNRALRETSLQIFDRTFAITQVLRLLSVAVAFIGVLSALMALQLERARELAVMRAVGLLPRELRVLVTYQTGLMGLFAGLLSLPLGLLLAHILVHAINKRSFGWTLQLSLSPGIFVQALLVALGAALLAGVYPGWRMSRANPAGALRD